MYVANHFPIIPNVTEPGRTGLYAESHGIVANVYPLSIFPCAILKTLLWIELLGSDHRA